MMSEKSELNPEKRHEVLQELKEKYILYSGLIKRNRLDMEHHKYCKQSDHSLCGAIWGHTDIMREIIARIWWWFTGEKPIFVKVSTKPRLEAILEQIKKQRRQEYWQENEIEDAEYDWLLNVLNKCKEIKDIKGAGLKIRKKKAGGGPVDEPKKVA